MKRFAIAITFLVAHARAGTLETPSFTIKIEARCAEGNVTCDNVSYVGTSKKTGKRISLTGHTIHSMCADRVTPCRFQGYEFKNGNTTYTVMEDGELIIMRGDKIVLQQHGLWQ